MTEQNAVSERKPRSVGAIRIARYRAKLKLAEVQRELEELEAEPASDAVRPDPAAMRAGMERARLILGQSYPLDRSGYDNRFTTSLVHEVAGMLERRGYPAVQPGRDMQRLINALAGFLYRPEQEADQETGQ